MVAETERELRLLHDKQRDRGGRRPRDRTCSPAPTLRDFAPYLADDLTGAVYCAREGHANPLLAAPLFAQRAIERGAASARTRRSRGRGADGRAPAASG